VKQQGKPNDLIERIKDREFFQPILPELQALLDPSTFTGRSSQIVEEVVSVNVAAALEKYAEDLKKEMDAELKV
jgi:adenylosuccinate lyase